MTARAKAGLEAAAGQPHEAGAVALRLAGGVAAGAAADAQAYLDLALGLGGLQVVAVEAELAVRVERRHEREHVLALAGQRAQRGVEVLLVLEVKLARHLQPLPLGPRRPTA